MVLSLESRAGFTHENGSSFPFHAILLAKVQDVVGLYVDPPEHALVLSVDEKSQIQALDRTQPALPMKQGRCGTMTYDYKRHGTTTLFAALDVLAGRVIGQCMSRHRHQEFIRFLNKIDRETPAGRELHLILDNYAMHKHPKVRAWLGRHPRFHFHFTPTSASWLNAVEGFFAKLTRQRLNRGVFKGIVDLQAAINRYLAETNDNPKPFIWTADPGAIIEKVRRGKTGVKRLWRGPMRLAFPISLLAIGLAALLGASATSAGALVEFPNLPGHEPARLLGYLAQPDGGLSAVAGARSSTRKPYPAVVVLHGCSGISSHSTGIADRLSSWGYVSLTVDSFGSRGIANRCSGPGLPDQPFDAYAAFHYLSGLKEVDPARVAVLGQSQGGYAALYANDWDLAAQYFAERFRAAIAYYPSCRIPGANMSAPTLILKGDADEWSSVDLCSAMVEHLRPDSAPITLIVYPSVHHAFDVALLHPGVRYLGHWLEYNQAAAKDAEEKTHAFLDAHVAEASPGGSTGK